MTDQEQLLLVRATLGSADGDGGMRPLCREVRRALRRLRKAYREAGQHKTVMDEWLSDNYSLLIRQGMDTLSALHRAHRQPCVEDLPATVRLFRQLAEKAPLTQALLEQILTAANRERPLTVFELIQLPICLRAALLLLAGDAVDGGGEEDATRLEQAIVGLRAAEELDYEGLTTRMSIVHRLLCGDPSGVYPQMDRLSREEYCRRTAVWAQKEGISEAVAAAKLIELAEQREDRHVGGILMEQDKPRRQRIARWWLTMQIVIPLISAVLLSVADGRAWLIPLLYLPLYELWKPLISYALARMLPTVRLPRMEHDGSVPEEARTVIVVSALLPAAHKAAKTAAHLFDLYGTNGRGAVQICLLADLKGAKQETLPSDEADIAAMKREIENLNRRVPDTFVLAVRAREFSPTMREYTGRERKRGALMQLANLIAGKDEPFLTIEGNVEKLRQSRYMLALDSDTEPLMDSLAELTAVARHPCSRPIVRNGRVVSGYGIFAPRMEVSLDSANATGFSRTMAGVGGVTPYDTVAGDLYMDGFDSGIFAGKGLIDVAALRAVTGSAFPAEQVLSHDILEGCLLRTAFVSDVVMTDGFPSSMRSWLDRLHRWVRGDWQNVTFLRRRFPFTAIDRFKLLDNLRRSLTAPIALVCLAFGGVSAAVGLFSGIAAQLLTVALALTHGGWLTLSGKYYSRVLPRAMAALIQAMTVTVMLPITAFTQADAAIRALTRLITRRKMLEWVTAADADARTQTWKKDLRRWALPMLAAGGLLFVGGFSRLCGVIFLLLPLVWKLSARPARQAEWAVSPERFAQLKNWASPIWDFYEALCTAEDHWLPPDNLQEAPVWRVAHRTSPTNIGLYLLSILAARDFGFIDVNGAIQRIENTLSTVEKLEKWRGNLLNWYDTRTLRPLQPRYVSTVDSGNFICCLVALRQGVLEWNDPRREALAQRIETLYRAAELAPLYHRRRALFTIGIDPETAELSRSYYDLLMSESRMTGYYAIATGQVPKKHWGALGRTLTRLDGHVGPVSWSGTMFEYFMPRLLLPAYEGTMSYEALRFGLHCQRRLVGRRIPWGISESGFYAFDGSLDYQYKAHGVPRLGLKRGLGADRVVSPYSSFLALTTDPEAAVQNLQRLEKMGVTGRFGFFEAVDYTPSRATAEGYSVVRSFMAHHLGMSMLSCANAAFSDVFVQRFMTDTEMARARELLWEKAPDSGTVLALSRERQIPEVTGRAISPTRTFTAFHPRHPQICLLAGAEWRVSLTDSGAGCSHYRGLDVTAADSDLLRRPQGIFAFVDAGDGAFSVTAAPDWDTDIARSAEFGPRYAVFFAQKGTLEAGWRVTVQPGSPGEQRQLVLKNHGNHRVRATVQFCFDPCLTTRRAFAAHPAFARLFLKEEKEASPRPMLLISAQRRDKGEPPACMAAGFLGGEDFEWEPSRRRLLTRPMGTRSLRESVQKPFSNGGDGVPDCTAAMRLTVEIPAKAQRSVTLVLAAGADREQAIAELEKQCAQGVLTPSRAANSPFGGVEAELAAQVLPDLLYPPRTSLSRAEACRKWTETARQAIPMLWSAGISGDYPVVLMEIYNAADASRAEPYMRLHRGLRLSGEAAELVILYREDGGYDAPVFEALRRVARLVRCEELLGVSGGIHTVNLALHAPELRTLLTAFCAHNCARDLRRPQLPSMGFTPLKIHPVQARTPVKRVSAYAIPGGFFDDDGFTVVGVPRVPWTYVLANRTFGTLVSDMAAGYTYAVNAREGKLTPWHNDVSTDNRSELLLLRTEEGTADVLWGAAATFGQNKAVYRAQWGVWQMQTTVRVPEKGNWKTVELELWHEDDREREVQAVYYTEPLLGVSTHTAGYVIAEQRDGMLLMKNRFGGIGGTAVLTAQGGADWFECDRAAFWSGRSGPGGVLLPLPDPCAAAVVGRKLPPRRREKITFVLGYAAHERAATCLPALAASRRQTGEKSFPRLHLPDEALNALLAFLPQQVLSSRLYARTGFYQCGGAWGFRDQLQDALAALWFAPRLTRQQLIRCAAVQFEEGDVLHWWHHMPRSAQNAGIRGVRTRCSDDLAWLPFVAATYVSFTGDGSVLDIPVRWLKGAVLTDTEQERYFVPQRTVEKATVYEHCVRALERAMGQTGAHGLPLIGNGDWNDGFNRVGAGGQGESVWLAMFLCRVAEAFTPLCDKRGDVKRAAWIREKAAAFREAAEASFDGDRYLRAYFDDGTPMGQQGQSACALDSLTQSFAVFAGLSPERTQTALNTALSLAEEEFGAVRLFTPPFTAESRPDPGYVAAYPTGVRENGGQYTHGAIWLIRALFQAGRASDGARLLRLINPVARYEDGTGAAYAGEPYALAGDVSMHPGCEGMAGWTQYTGAAGWLYDTVLRQIFGLEVCGKRLYVRPNLPPEWPWADAELTLADTPLTLHLSVRGVLHVDGKPADYVSLDGRPHVVTTE